MSNCKTLWIRKELNMYYLLDSTKLTTPTQLGVFINDIDTDVQKAEIKIENLDWVEVPISENKTKCLICNNLQHSKTYTFFGRVLVNDIWIELKKTAFKTYPKNWVGNTPNILPIGNKLEINNIIQAEPIKKYSKKSENI